MKIQSLLSEDMILTDLFGRSRDDVLKEMVDFLKAKKRISKPRDIFEKLIQRETLGSTAIGEGVAIPHCKMKGLSAPLFMLAVSRVGVPFDSLDGKPSYVFFLIVSSPENPGLNLQILAAVAQLVRRTSFLTQKILQASTVRGIIDVIRTEEGT